MAPRTPEESFTFIGLLPGEYSTAGTVSVAVEVLNKLREIEADKAGAGPRLGQGHSHSRTASRGSRRWHLYGAFGNRGKRHP